MTDRTRLDTAFANMEAPPADDTARLRFYEILAASELFLLLKSEAKGDQITPETIDLYEQTFVFAFDLENRLTDLAGGPAPYAALSGRALCEMLAPQDIGIALNSDVAPSSFFIPAEAVKWLAEILSHAPQEVEQKPEKLFSPKGLPESFLTALDTRLASATGLAQSAYLVGVQYQGSGQGHLLAFVDALPGTQPALTRIAMETLTFSGLDAAILDVAFFASSDPVTSRLAKEGLRFDLPQPVQPSPPVPPGTDPQKPPKLK